MSDPFPLAPHRCNPRTNLISPGKLCIFARQEIEEESARQAVPVEISKKKKKKTNRFHRQNFTNVESDGETLRAVQITDPGRDLNEEIVEHRGLVR